MDVASVAAPSAYLDVVGGPAAGQRPYSVALERSTVSHAGAASVVAFEVAVTNKRGSPLAFDPSDEIAQLWLPDGQGGSYPVTELHAGSPPPPIAPHATQRSWFAFSIPTAETASLTDQTSDLVVYARYGAQPYMGEIRLWRTAGARGQAAVAGLSG